MMVSLGTPTENIMVNCNTNSYKNRNSESIVLYFGYKKCYNIYMNIKYNKERIFYESDIGK